MNATRATTMTNDGAVFGTTAETPPDPPPWVNARKIAHILLGLAHIIGLIAHFVNN